MSKFIVVFILMFAMPVFAGDAPGLQEYLNHIDAAIEIAKKQEPRLAVPLLTLRANIDMYGVDSRYLERFIDMCQDFSKSVLRNEQIKEKSSY